MRILVFFKTKGYIHPSIIPGVDALQKTGAQKGVLVDTTRDARYFTQDSLNHYAAVIFLNTTQNVLNNAQQTAFERYIQAGGGYAGLHAATDTEYDWAWYNKLVGAQFLSHPRPQKANIRIVDHKHPSTSFLPTTWERKDEWYNFKNIDPGIKVLAVLDESSYEGGKNGKDHPIAWYHDYDGGRAFYTGGGHFDETFTDTLFMRHLWGGIEYAMGGGQPLDWTKAYAIETPEENRFVKKILANDLNEPMELAVAPDGKVFYIERTGNFYQYDPITKKNRLLKKFPVFSDKGNGLLGIVPDPAYAFNKWMYFFYTPVTDSAHLRQQVSRFTMGNNGPLPGSEKVLLRIPIDLEASAHTGGSMAFDRQGNLFISVGDNTTPSQSSGYAPIDEISGRKVFNAQRTSANTQDLRGKILRIHPEKNTTYTIPAGNLFPADGKLGRPEIYVMGCRNPYRITVDTATSYLYWGEVGPDAGKDGEQGPRGYDEFNRATGPGNFGWPYFVDDNKPYKQYNFATKTTGHFFDPLAPTNLSPANTGATTLPPAQKAMIWYPYSYADEFPLLGLGGRCAMGGPVYHYNPKMATATSLPSYYDKAWFVFDWMRNWVIALRLDSGGNYQRMEPFLPLTGDFRRPMDIELGSDGTMYLLEYGSIYGIDNEDARLVKVEYNPGNRKPKAKAGASALVGRAPLRVSFNSRGSTDPDDEDKLSYEWLFDGKTLGATSANAAHTFTRNGTYTVVLRVKDAAGAMATDTLKISVGNTPPQVAIETPGNKSFYWNNHSIAYKVAVKDSEDIRPRQQRLKIYFDYLAGDASQQTGHQEIAATPDFSTGANLIAGSDCKACHQLDKKAVGPSFMSVSVRYKNDAQASRRLAKKIISGGGGVWGEHAMNAHPQLSEKQATDIVNYILSLSKPKVEKPRLPQNGSVAFKKHSTKDTKGKYVLSATYTDGGATQTKALSASAKIEWRHPRVPAVAADELYDAKNMGLYVGQTNDGAYIMFKQVDLTGIKSIICQISSQNSSGDIEIRTGKPNGQLIGTIPYEASGVWNKKFTVEGDISPGTAIHDLYLVIKKRKGPERGLINFDWVEFLR
jgi:cytochrome c